MSDVAPLSVRNIRSLFIVQNQVTGKYLENRHLWGSNPRVFTQIAHVKSMMSQKIHIHEGEIRFDWLHRYEDLQVLQFFLTINLYPKIVVPFIFTKVLELQRILKEGELDAAGSDS